MALSKVTSNIPSSVSNSSAADAAADEADEFIKRAISKNSGLINQLTIEVQLLGMGDQDVDAAELEHIIGFSGQEPHALVVHPVYPNIILYGIGHVVVLSDQVSATPNLNTMIAAIVDLLRG